VALNPDTHIILSYGWHSMGRTSTAGGVTDSSRGYDTCVEHMESPAKAERKQARERQFLPPMWPLLAIVVVIVGITVWLSH
jgi:hypothetical protein